MGTIAVSLPSDATIADVSDYNVPITTIVTELNGNIDSNNLAANAVSTSKVTDDAITMPKINNPYTFSVYLTSSFNTGVTGFAKVPFDSEAYDTNNNFDAATNFRYTAPVNGVYHFDAQVKTGVLGATRRIIISLYKNGVEYTQGGEDTAATNYIGVGLGVDMQLSTSDYVEIYVYTSDGQAFDNTGQRCRFSGHLVNET